jgi:hypothetical protein
MMVVWGFQETGPVVALQEMEGQHRIDETNGGIAGLASLADQRALSSDLE